MPFSFDQFKEKSVPQISAVAAIIIFFILRASFGYLTLGKSALMWEESIPRPNIARISCDALHFSILTYLSELQTQSQLAHYQRRRSVQTSSRPDLVIRSHFGRRLGVQWVSRSSARLAPTAWRQSKKSKRLK